MKLLKSRQIAFHLHRYIGLVVGLLLVIVGLTGSLLVFADEIDLLLLSHQIGQVIPQGQRVSIESELYTVEAAYKDRPEFQAIVIRTPLAANAPHQVLLRSPKGEITEVNVNPYTGAIMGSRIRDRTFRTLLTKLHEELLVGEIGGLILGIVGLLSLLLSITGILLWPGWKKLIPGFKIKLKAHPKRVNFDIHKVIGIIAAIFLGLTGFTGFCWNFESFTQPIIYALTLTPNPPDPVSQPLPSRTPLQLGQILKKADAALPDGLTTFIILPTTPEATFNIAKKLPHEAESFGRSRLWLDRYTGDLVQIKNTFELSLGDQIFDSFTPLHFGTFGGLPTRILYVFVGLTPLILFITSLVMYRYRYQGKRIKRLEKSSQQ
ncbi:PepSY-associated TM helix domain-containing protein [Nostoc sp.]|uniref:PepSY-associated TM helix domain-containing protein n=1 Tax=Nostoc sp. TaxID=1180 RepID=UPI002FFA0899